MEKYLDLIELLNVRIDNANSKIDCIYNFRDADKVQLEALNEIISGMLDIIGDLQKRIEILENKR